MSYETLLIEKNEGVGRITFNRPKVFNAYNPQLASELIDAVTALEKNPERNVLVLPGSGKAFMSGVRINKKERRCKPRMRHDKRR